MSKLYYEPISFAGSVVRGDWIGVVLFCCILHHLLLGLY